MQPTHLGVLAGRQQPPRAQRPGRGQQPRLALGSARSARLANFVGRNADEAAAEVAAKVGGRLQGGGRGWVGCGDGWAGLKVGGGFATVM